MVKFPEIDPSPCPYIPATPSFKTGGDYTDALGFRWRCVEPGFPGVWEPETLGGEILPEDAPSFPVLARMKESAKSPRDRILVYAECGRSLFPGCWHLVDYTAAIRARKRGNPELLEFVIDPITLR